MMIFKVLIKCYLIKLKSEHAIRLMFNIFAGFSHLQDNFQRLNQSLTLMK